MAKTYTQEEIEYILDARLRHPRPTPWPVIAQGMGLQPYRGSKLARVVWGIATGYGENNGEVRLHWENSPDRVSRAGVPWTEEDQRLLDHGRSGEGQIRTPPVTAAYIAAVLSRPIEEVAPRWCDPTGLKRDGFGVAKNG